MGYEPGKNPLHLVKDPGRFFSTSLNIATFPSVSVNNVDLLVQNQT